MRFLKRRNLSESPAPPSSFDGSMGAMKLFVLVPVKDDVYEFSSRSDCSVPGGMSVTVRCSFHGFERVLLPGENLAEVLARPVEVWVLEDCGGQEAWCGVDDDAV
jgi:hypothetical protein